MVLVTSIPSPNRCDRLVKANQPQKENRKANLIEYAEIKSAGQQSDCSGSWWVRRRLGMGRCLQDTEGKGLQRRGGTESDEIACRRRRVYKGRNRESEE